MSVARFLLVWVGYECGRGWLFDLHFSPRLFVFIWAYERCFCFCVLRSSGFPTVLSILSPQCTVLLSSCFCLRLNRLNLHSEGYGLGPQKATPKDIWREPHLFFYFGHGLAFFHMAYLCGGREGGKGWTDISSRGRMIRLYGCKWR